MPVRVRYSIPIVVSQDVAAKRLIFSRDVDDNEEKIDSFLHGVSGNFTTAPASNENLSFGDVTAPRGLYIECDSDFNLTLNGAATPLLIRLADTEEGRLAHVFLEAVITSVNIANPSATEPLDGAWCIFGDPEP